MSRRQSPKISAAFAIRQADIALGQAGLDARSIFRRELRRANRQLAALVSTGNAYVHAELACAQDFVGRKVLLEAKEAARAAFVAALADCGGDQ